MGIRETGEYEILGFYPFAQETLNKYSSVIQDVYNEGVGETLLFDANGKLKLGEWTCKIFPGSDFQLYKLHASGNRESDAMESGRIKINRDLK